jgi:hypothetical protein
MVKNRSPPALQSNNTATTVASFRLLDNNTGATTLTSLDRWPQ